MNIFIIPDSFKDSISSIDIITALSAGFKSLDPSIKIFSCVASDGGEGFIEAVSNSKKVEPITSTTIDAVGKKINGKYLYDNKATTAYIELAQASGLEGLKIDERNPMYTSTKGTGIQILEAIENGAKKVVIGLGGSATTDAGLGILKYLGYVFKDKNDAVLEPNGKNLEKISKISGANQFPNVDFLVVNDVNNPLYDANGAAFVYSEQKGASIEEIELLDLGLKNVSKIAVKNGFDDFSNFPGAGAAGGVAFGLMTFLNAKSISGIDFLFKIINVEQILLENQVDFIITGEGSLDSQSLHGKLIHGVCKLGSKFRIPVIAICGKLALKESEYKREGIYYATTIASDKISKEDSIKNARRYIEELPKKLLPLMQDFKSHN